MRMLIVFSKTLIFPLLVIWVLSAFLIRTDDYVSYQMVYESVPASFLWSYDYSDLIYGGAVEISYMQLMSLARFFDFNFLYFYFGCMCLILIAYQYIFINFFNSWFWGVIAFSSWSLIIFANNFRLAIASAILIAFINLLMRGHFLLYLLVIVFAATFHVAALSFILVAMMYRYDFFYKNRYLIVLLTFFLYFAKKGLDGLLIKIISNYISGGSYIYDRIQAYSSREDKIISMLSLSGLRNVIIICLGAYIDYKFGKNKLVRLFLCLNICSFFYLYAFSDFVVVGTYFHNLVFIGSSLMLCFVLEAIKTMPIYQRVLILQLVFLFLLIQFLFITKVL